MEQKQTNFDTPDDPETEKRLRSRFMPDKPDIKHNGNEGQIDEKIAQLRFSITVTSETVKSLTERLQGVIVKDADEKDIQDNLVHSKMSQLEFALAELNNSIKDINDRLNKLITNIRL